MEWLCGKREDPMYFQIINPDVERAEGDGFGQVFKLCWVQSNGWSPDANNWGSCEWPFEVHRTEEVVTASERHSCADGSAAKYLLNVT